MSREQFYIRETVICVQGAVLCVQGAVLCVWGAVLYVPGGSWVSLESLRGANSWPAPGLQGGEGEGSPPLCGRRLEGWRQEARSTRPEARGLGG